VGIPGTGLFYTTTSPARDARRTRARDLAPEVRPEDRLTLGFFRRLVTPAGEEAFIDGCRELALGSEAKALDHLRRSDLADGFFLAGFLTLKRGLFDEARMHFRDALADEGKLGRYFDKYGIASTISLPITDEVAAHMGPDPRGILLALVEAHQKQERWDEALGCLKRLRELAPGDPVVTLSLAELLTEARPGDKAAAKEVVRTSQGIGNDSPVHTALLLYRAKAMRTLGLLDGARDVLTKALRRKKERPADLMHALRYERALAYEALGQQKRARSDLEKLYAVAPDYEDVAQRLGL
jgi:tetratricopeptide (TPR) repeat protein